MKMADTSKQSCDKIIKSINNIQSGRYLEQCRCKDVALLFHL